MHARVSFYSLPSKEYQQELLYSSLLVIAVFQYGECLPCQSAAPFSFYFLQLLLQRGYIFRHEAWKINFFLDYNY